MWVVKIKGRFDLLFKAQNDRDRETLYASVEKWWQLPTTSLLAILLD